MIDDDTIRKWFFQEVFPLESALTRFIRRNWRNEDEVNDLRQDVYAKIYSAARTELPAMTKAYLFSVARNHLINEARRAKIVSIDLISDLESYSVAVDNVTPVRNLLARDELRRVQNGLDRLPPRCRDVVFLRKVEGLSTKETAARLHVTVSTVEQQLMHGMRALTDFMLGGPGRIRRPAGDRRQTSKGDLS